MQQEIKFKFDEIAIKRINNFSNRPVIIFLHDSLGCIELWRDFPQKIIELANCNVLIYDRQGYGKSCSFSNSKRDNYYLEHEADILNALLDYWNIDKAILFGHSDGGSIALIAASKYPEKISGIIIEGAHIFVEDITIAGIKEVEKLYQTSNLNAKLKKYHGSNTDKMFWAWVTTWTSKEFRNWNIEKFLPLIKCPLLFIQGEADEFGTLKQVETTISSVKGISEKFIIPDVGHSPHKENQEKVLEKTIQFISQFT